MNLLSLNVIARDARNSGNNLTRIEKMAKRKKLNSFPKIKRKFTINIVELEDGKIDIRFAKINPKSRNLKLFDMVVANISDVLLHTLQEQGAIESEEK